MIILFDTEFTSFTEPQLLSIGLVAEDGSECYVELNLECDAGRQRLRQSSKFVRDEVINQFRLIENSGVESELAMGHQVADWLAALQQSTGGPLQLAYDFAEDGNLLARKLKSTGRSGDLQIKFVDIGGLCGIGQFVMAAEDYFESLPKAGPRRHHALADARAMRLGFLAVQYASHSREGSSP